MSINENYKPLCGIQKYIKKIYILKMDQLSQLFHDDSIILSLIVENDKLKLFSYLKLKSNDLASKFKNIYDITEILHTEWDLYIKYEKALSILGDTKSKNRIDKIYLFEKKSKMELSLWGIAEVNNLLKKFPDFFD